MKASERAAAKEAFLASLQTDPNVSLACDMAGISRDTAYRWKEQDQAFAKRWADAVERCKDIARSSIYRRGILGWYEPVVSNGQLVYRTELDVDEKGNLRKDSKGHPLYRRVEQVMVQKWSDSLAALYAKANLPEYKDKPQVDLQVQLSDLADQAKEDLLADLSAALANEDKAH